jgi:cytoskeletal protein RodZ
VVEKVQEENKREMIRQWRFGYRIRAPINNSHLSLQHIPHSLFSSSSTTYDGNERKLMKYSSSRSYSMTTRKENPLIIGGIGILAVAGSLHVGLMLYQQFQQKKNSSPETTTTTDEKKSTVDEVTAKSSSEQKTQEDVKTEEKPEENATGSSFFGNFFATTFYDGGFGKL